MTAARAEAGRDRDHDRGGGVPLGALPALLVVVLLGGGAILGAVDSSLHPGRIVGGDVGPSAWTSTLSDPAFHDAVRFTLWIAVATTVVSAPLAVLLAAAVRRSRLGAAIAGLPVPMAHVAVAGLVVAWLAPGGLVERLFGSLPFDVVADRHGVGIVLTYVAKEVPFLALVVIAAWDPATEERAEVAAAFGARRRQVLRDVVVPRVAPALVLASVVVAAFVIGATEVPLVVGASSTETIATWAIDVVRLRGPVARADATVALLVATVLAVAVVVATISVGRLTRSRR